jgi:hypothetical protein
VTLSISDGSMNDTRYNNTIMLSVEFYLLLCHYAEYHYDECRYGDCRYAECLSA